MEEEQVAVLWISWLAAAASGAIMEMVPGVQEVKLREREACDPKAVSSVAFTSYHRQGAVTL